MELPPLRMPGATLVTRLKVYDTPSPDGQGSGTPHFHLGCTEMYFTLAGSGGVEIIDSNGFKYIELPQYSAFVFSAGSLHRLISKGNLEVLIIMQNSGLPERGDTICTFKKDVMADELRYHKAIRVNSLEEAYRRRNDSVDGFLEIKAAFERSQEEGRAALEELYRSAQRLTKSKHKDWYETVAKGAFAEAQESLHHIVDLTAGKLNYLKDAQHFFMASAPYNTVGYCGTLNRYFDPATFLPEGVKV